MFFSAQRASLMRLCAPPHEFTVVEQPFVQVVQVGGLLAPLVQLVCIDPDVSTITKNHGLTWTVCARTTA